MKNCERTLQRRWLLRRGAAIKLALAVLAIASCAPISTFAATYTTPRALKVGDIYQLTRDGWYSPPGGSTYEGDVIPKIDANEDAGRDNSYFRRFNVTRAWPTDTGYWFTFSDQNAGEPAPGDPQWVDYVPPIEILGSGRYVVEASYRWGSARATYPALYRIHHALGTNEVLRDQRIGSAGASIYWLSLGEFEMRPGSYVRVEDTGSESITFGNMKFYFMAPVPRLEMTTTNRIAMLRWSTNSTGYYLQSAASLDGPMEWERVSLEPAEADGEFHVTIPINEPERYFRLTTP